MRRFNFCVGNEYVVALLSWKLSMPATGVVFESAIECLWRRHSGFKERKEELRGFRVQTVVVRVLTLDLLYLLARTVVWRNECPVPGRHA